MHTCGHPDTGRSSSGSARGPRTVAERRTGTPVRTRDDNGRGAAFTTAAHRRPLKNTVVAVVLAVAVVGVAPSAGQDRVSDTVHNLSAAGPGPVRAEAEGQVCVFCHAPHNTGGLSPLWNRELPQTNYDIYQSSTLDANPGQPTGSSKLCLSCHDGTIALGSVLSRADQIRMIGGEYIPAGLTNLSTDLSDDHPISFYYTSSLAASDQQLADPATLDPAIRLDATGQLQCTACHDPHHNAYGDFLVMPSQFGALCVACHVMDGWGSCSHLLSSASVSAVQGAEWPYATVAENACRSCHRSHAAGGRERLLILENEEDNCLICHGGLVASANIAAELDKPSVHDPRRYLGVHDPVETPSGTRPHVECTDCHNPHAVAPQPPVSDYIPIGATLSKAQGVTVGGMSIDQAQYEYEVCFRCHGDSPVPAPRRISRQADTPNLRLAFSTTNPSYHPVVNASPSPDTVSLVPTLIRGTMIRCTDCHNNDSNPRSGGVGPDGPHGSTYDYLLERNYTVRDDTVESEFEYELCYKCHQQSSILGDQSFKEHRKHIVDQRSPCSACHDPHGVSTTTGTSSDHTHLINFDVSIVLPNPNNQRREFKDLGGFAGSCTLQCHDVTHDDQQYSLVPIIVPGEG